MVTKNEQLQQMMQLYRAETGNKTLDMELVAEWAMKKGVVAPQPKTAKELLAAQFSQAAREEHRQDPKTGWSYRANHALRVSNNGKQLTLWVDIDDATRPQMLASLTSRRQQMVGDGTQLKIDETVWNNRHNEEEPINLVLDFTDDVEERLNSPDYDSGEAS
ncbi:hypothetical protein GCM10009007_06820 [Formosimonas limnophila]|uniref:Uncharacterized protein n=1 Tax=Formosimonas limnophila TaxID=1384487 RepID=A0A8J3CGL6_9BURK|nr:hypothetical protein [Formosimonas limnophila]GHA68694.1 hypothetical protein GCM10009007_06820 [Formosimonas limnophila]